MIKKKNKTFVDKKNDELIKTLNSLIDRITELENFVVFQSKLLNSNILRTAALIKILSEKGIISADEVDKQSEEILNKIKESTESQKMISLIKDLLNSDDIGHA